MPANYPTKPKGGAKGRRNFMMSVKFAKQAAFATGAEYDEELEWANRTPDLSNEESNDDVPTSVPEKTVIKKKDVVEVEIEKLPMSKSPMSKRQMRLAKRNSLNASAANTGDRSSSGRNTLVECLAIMGECLFEILSSLDTVGIGYERDPRYE